MSEYLSPEERVEWNALLSDALNGSRRVDDDAIDRAERMLSDAEQAHRSWVGIVTRGIIRSGLRGHLSQISKAEHVVLMAHNGSVVSTTTQLGVKRRRSDGSVERQLEALSVISWAQLEEWLSLIEAQIDAGLVNRAKANRLLALRSQFPDTVGPAEACERMGVTVEQYLERVA
jgi:hypothetical protein